MNLLKRNASLLGMALTTALSLLFPRPAAAQQPDNSRQWWKEAVVYQIYPRSFKDSDGDGMGDLKGIISRLDYIKNLGVNVVWLNPIFTSPNVDNGYDISDYRNIMKEMGTMQDFDALLKGMHERGIRLVLDLVVNHSSDEHEWFRQSKSSRTNPYRNYYHWWNEERGKPTPRVSFFDENKDAWRYDSTTRSYYLHYFHAKQPDLNWENPNLRKEIYSMMRWWFDKGVDGFRMDVIPFISKDTTWPALPPQYKYDAGGFYAKGPQLHTYLQEMNKEVLSRYDIMTVGEGAGVAAEDALKFVAEDRHELQTFYHFEVQSWGRRKENGLYPDPNNRKLPDLKAIFTKWDSIFGEKGWGTVYWTTHDQSRAVSRFGNDSTYRNESAKMLHTLLLTMRATPYIYMGDELGMSNIRFKSINDYQDVEIHTNYENLKKTGGDTTALILAQAELARENSRTPFQWNSEQNAGFSTGKPWIRVNPNYTAINAEAAEKDAHAPLHYIQKMIALRKANPILIYGNYKLLDKQNPEVFAYTRELNGKKLLVLLSFSNKGGSFKLPAGLKPGNTMINNYGEALAIQKGVITLKPWQAAVVWLR
jgi:oligo-1,6-glucosidase